MPQTVKEALVAAKFITDNERYRLVRLHPRAITTAAGVVAEIGQPFCALIVDRDEVTLMIPDDAVADFAERLRDHKLGETYRLITVDAELAPDLIGFMAVLSQALADARVGVFPYAAYTRDHIMVPELQLTLALETLEQLQTKYGA
jgi:hypothetical protein